ncbi:MAG: SGNH/GDSL hydrolase family protein [Acutalibacteraceae bacterium]|jgi:lysophospholipase L1-like esterase
MAHIGDGKVEKEFNCLKDRPNIFIIGDSIRLGYCETVKKELENAAEVFYPDENCRSTQFVISSLNRWSNKLSDKSLINLVQFNCGHWDVAHWLGYEQPLTSIDEYEKNIKMIIALLRKIFVNAKIIFATTTTMNPNGSIGLNPRSNSEIDRYNQVAVKVATEQGVLINDLNKITRDWGSECYADYCHFTKEAFQTLGKEVARYLKEFL